MLRRTPPLFWITFKHILILSPLKKLFKCSQTRSAGWTREVRLLLSWRDNAFRSRDEEAYSSFRLNLKRGIREAKYQYKLHIEDHFNNADPITCGREYGRSWTTSLNLRLHQQIRPMNWTVSMPGLTSTTRNQLPKLYPSRWPATPFGHTQEGELEESCWPWRHTW